MADRKSSLQREVSLRGMLLILLWFLWPVVYLSFGLWYYGRYPGGDTLEYLLMKAFLPALVVTVYCRWRIGQSGSGESLLFKEEMPRDLPQVQLGGYLLPPDAVAIPAPSAGSVPTTPPPARTACCLVGESAPAAVQRRTVPSALAQFADKLLADPVQGLARLAGVFTGLMVFFILLAQLATG